jgi:integrase
MKLTTAAVAALALPPGKTDHIEWDDELPGFGVRLRGNSSRWVVQYRAGTKQGRESLGDVRKVTLDAARKIARQRFAQVELGTDPVAQRKAAAAALTLAKTMDRYLEAKQDVVRPATYKAAKRYFERAWKPLRERPLNAITRADVAARLQELIKLHGRTSAARARDYLSAMYGWAMREGLTESNPAAFTNDPAAGIPERKRVLSDDEIRAVWNACTGEDHGFSTIVKLLLLTGCRRTELGALRWSEYNDSTGMLTIPGERTKNKEELVLPLPPLARALLEAMPRQDDIDYVFGRLRGPFSGWSAAKLRLDARITMAIKRPLPRWVLHDLRRTMRSGLGKVGTRPDIAELAINHVKKGMKKIYDQHDYLPEIKVALAKWARHVEALVEGRKDDKVVTLHA